jgi:hypothetical protein
VRTIGAIEKAPTTVQDNVIGPEASPQSVNKATPTGSNFEISNHTPVVERVKISCEANKLLN